MNQFPTINKNILLEFGRKNGYKNLTETLKNLVSKTADFSIFLKSHGLSLNTIIPTTILFHGSQLFLTHLSPSPSDGKIYASDDPNYAIFLAILDLKSGSASAVEENSELHLSVDKDFIKGGSSFKEGYLYVIDGEGFHVQGNREYISKKNAQIIFCCNVSKEDLTIPITINQESTS